MSETLTPMDVYSVYLDVPFDIATFCRGHKLSVEAVNLMRAIRARQAAEKAVKDAQDNHDNSKQIVRDAVARVREKMEKARGV